MNTVELEKALNELSEYKDSLPWLGFTAKDASSEELRSKRALEIKGEASHAIGESDPALTVIAEQI